MRLPAVAAKRLILAHFGNLPVETAEDGMIVEL
jgi:hypothetical protein